MSDVFDEKARALLGAAPAGVMTADELAAALRDAAEHERRTGDDAAAVAVLAAVRKALECPDGTPILDHANDLMASGRVSWGVTAKAGAGWREATERAERAEAACAGLREALEAVHVDGSCPACRNEKPCPAPSSDAGKPSLDLLRAARQLVTFWRGSCGHEWDDTDGCERCAGETGNRLEQAFMAAVDACGGGK